MRPAQYMVPLALCLSSMTPIVSASAWPGWLPRLDSLVVRANNDDAVDATATRTASAAAKTVQPTKGTARDLNTAEPTKSGDVKETGSSKDTKETGADKSGDGGGPRTTFAPDAPAGGVSMLSPAIMTQPTPLYKISDYVTWSWNYTSLLGTPTAVDILVSCTQAGVVTIASNMSFATSVNYVWDTRLQAGSAENPLRTDMYTLIIKASDAEITDRPEPGYLGTWSGFRFGLYSARPYQPFSEWKCPGVCSAASSLPGHEAVRLALTMSLLSLTAFTWFVVGLGLP
ncbi:hypothetical protein RJ55_03464 [Drechmeria coniospora]|nr:hypothetical protein RJ55_03464 [Drechmeria coniospora]